MECSAVNQPDFSLVLCPGAANMVTTTHNTLTKSGGEVDRVTVTYIRVADGGLRKHSGSPIPVCHVVISIDILPQFYLELY